MSVPEANYPSGFYCPLSERVMRDPAFHPPCGRVFDRSVIGEPPISCPFDHQKLEGLIPFAELKRRISRAVASPPPPVFTHQTFPTLSLSQGGSAFESCRPQAEATSSHPLINPRVKWRVENAHRDDVHGIRFFGEGFVTGSKDGCLYQWNTQGERLEELYQRDNVDYKEWFTAIGSNDSCLLAGTRNGMIHGWDKEGFKLNAHPWQLKAGEGHRAKERNLNRIACITVLPSQAEQTPFFVGGPQSMHFCSVNVEGEFTHHSSTQVHANDWVYCIQPLKKEEPLGDQLVVIGAHMDLRKRNSHIDPYTENAWKRRESIVQENKAEVGRRGKQPLRPHIASIEPQPLNPNHIAYACFENSRGYGPIRIVDVEKRKIIFDGQEHQGRSWDVAFVAPHVFASGADDCLIKLWDTRLKERALYTFPKQIGRVSCLVSPKEDRLLSAACPDDVKSSSTKAQLSYWDLRVV